MDRAIQIEIPEVSRIAVHLNKNSDAEGEIRLTSISSGLSEPSEIRRYESYELVSSELWPLPDGSAFVTDNRVLY